MNIRKRAAMVVVAFSLAVISIAVVRTVGQEGNGSDRIVVDQWEYLAVAGPSTTNFSATSSPRMRKEPNAPFGREAFVLEQHLDKLGANGWELVAVAGPPTDPAYYFKRRKQADSQR